MLLYWDQETLKQFFEPLYVRMVAWSGWLWSNCWALWNVGCIYASHLQYKSNILQYLSNSFKLSPKHSKLLKNIFLYFSVFLLTLVRVFFHFSVLHIVRRFVFCFRLEVWFQVEKRLPACWLNPTSWLSTNLGAKVPGEQVYASETKLAYALSPQCLHSLRRWASTLLYNIFINSFRSCIIR